MGSDQRIDDAKRVLGDDAEEFDIEYEEKPEESDSGMPQLILYGDIIEKNTIQKLSKAGFEFLFAQTEGDDEDDEEEDAKGTVAELEDEDEDYGTMEIVFEDF
jgi:hypothetical protein